jgi:PKD repeat protein
VLNQAKHAMTYLWADNQTTWELHHYYGDPAMQMWTAAPTTTTVSHPTSVTTSSTTISITSSNCAYGIATLVYEDTLVGKTTLSSGGTGTITFASLSGTESTAILTVSKHNYKPYTANITVESGPPVAPVAEFSASATTVYTGSSINFSDQSSNGPTSWSWTFTGGTPSSSTAQNPTITYNTVGTYTVSLIATNSVGSDTETKTNYITVQVAPLNYCTTQGNDYSYEWIANVQVSDINNSSGASGYTDFTSIEGDLDEGATINVSCSPGFSGSTYTEYWKIYIDYNIDGDFEDSGEEVFYSIGSSTVTGSFVVPSGVSGQTRMRVSMKYNSAQTPCETFTYGEVEDYTVNLIPGTPQPPVANFSANDTTIYEGGNVTFTDTSTNNPTSWTWTFTGGTPSSSTAQNPTITYNTAGAYTVSLIATNAEGSDTETKTNYITVSTAPTTGEVGITSVYSSTSTSGYRRAMPFTMPEDGTITSVTMYHTGGSGDMILAVYDGSSAPTNRLAVTPTTAISGSTGWQTINLSSGAFVSGGSTVWLAWVYSSNPGIRYQTGSPGRYQSTSTWSGGMPNPFGSGSQTNYLYSIYATYNK